MKNENLYTSLHEKISPLVHEADPVALGGADGEYENEVNQVIKLIMSKKSLITGEEIKKIFLENYNSISLDDNEIEELEVKINKVISSINFSN